MSKMLLEPHRIVTSYAKPGQLAKSTPEPNIDGTKIILLPTSIGAIRRVCCVLLRTPTKDLNRIHLSCLKSAIPEK